MLVNLLPGLRTLRTPLAVGYLWLLGLWLIFAQELPTSDPKTIGPVHSVFEAETFLGSGTVLAALSFLAYLLGIMILWRLDWNIFIVMYPELSQSPLRTRNFLITKLFTPLSRPLLLFHRPKCHALQGQLVLILARKLRTVPEEHRNEATLLVTEQIRTPARTNTFTTWTHDSEDIHTAAVLGGQLPEVSIQLQAANRDLWDAFDRARAESEFRSAIVWPIIPVICVAALHLSPWWWLLITIPVLLLFLAMGESVQATSTLVQAMALGVVDPPVFGEIDDMTARKEKGTTELKV